ncbi:hypothetical protein [Stutzerimonas azotifigens]|uniref:hypothetical protein n=1 Tax=Stutzerimonas azotifigens TaxID=291995 RepID=UPI001C6169A2|nr:hypothetical protein [Stutzerimonas azotifigens]
MNVSGLGNVVIERAQATDIAPIKSIVVAAYSKYIERIGKPPAPVTENYEELIRLQGLYVLRLDGDVVGAIHLSKTGDSMSIGNLVVDPPVPGPWLGSAAYGIRRRPGTDGGVARIDAIH